MCTVRMLVAFAVGLLLTGCDHGKAPVDTFGCPNLTGAYVAPAEHAGDMFNERSFVSMPVQEWLVSASSTAGVAVERAGPDAFRFRWILDEPTMRTRYAWMRDEHPADYAAWYHHTVDGAALPAAVEARIPVAEHTVTIERNKDFSCKDGRVVIGELRLYRDGDALVGERTHVTGPEVDVWCGDGCKSVTLPTGTTVERVRWPPGTVAPWAPDPGRLGRPQADVEQDEARYREAQAIEAARTFAPADVIQRRIQALATPGTEVKTVTFEGGYRVWVEFEAPEGHEPWLLRAIDDANGTARGPEHVQTTSTVDRRTTRTRFSLEKSPVVAPETAVAGAVSAAPSGDLVPIVDR